VRGDEPGAAAHQLDNPDAVGHVSLCLRFGGLDGLHRFLHRGVEPKRAVNQIKVVVDRFGNAHYRDRQRSCRHFFVDPLDAAMRAVPSNDVQVGDAVPDIQSAEIDRYIPVQIVSQ
jgi:hypothetical protein